MDLGIEGRVALVLGAGGGLGSAIATSLASEGCKLALADFDSAALKTTSQAVRAFGSPDLSLAWDIADRGLVEERVASIELSLGPVDILVCITGGPPPSLAADTPAAVWIDHFNKMVVSVMAITTRVLPGMRQRGWGRIITSTSSGVVAPIANLAVSNALRSALVGWSKTLAREVARDGVTVNVLTPGRIATSRVHALDVAKAAREKATVEEVAARSAHDIPIGRYGRPQEYADMLSFLASDRASYITGSAIRVDGGLIPSI